MLDEALHLSQQYPYFVAPYKVAPQRCFEGSTVRPGAPFGVFFFGDEVIFFYCREDFLYHAELRNLGNSPFKEGVRQVRVALREEKLIRKEVNVLWNYKVVVNLLIHVEVPQDFEAVESVFVVQSGEVLRSGSILQKICGRAFRRFLVLGEHDFFDAMQKKMQVVLKVGDVDPRKGVSRSQGAVFKTSLFGYLDCRGFDFRKAPLNVFES